MTRSEMRQEVQVDALDGKKSNILFQVVNTGHCDKKEFQIDIKSFNKVENAEINKRVVQIRS